MNKRIRLLISRGAESKYLSHLDVSRVWIRACRRAGLNVKYSEGFSPRPKLTIAAPLPVGVMAQADFLEIECAELARTVMQVLPTALPAGFGVHGAMEIDSAAPSLQASVYSAEYNLLVPCGLSLENIQGRLKAFLAAEEIIFKRLREGSMKEFNIRPLVLDAETKNLKDGILMMRVLLKCSMSGTGRSEEFCAALGLAAPLSITRTRLFLQD